MTFPWTAVALARDLAPGSVTGICLNGEDRALWRGGDGVAHAFEDRCPHRGMRMSLGFVRGNRIGCLYHGWQFDGAGQCRAIPAHPEIEIPKMIAILALQVAEAAGLVWVATAEAPPLEMPFAGLHAVPVRSVYVDRPLADALAALRSTPVEAFAGAGAGRFAPVAGLEHGLELFVGGDRVLIAGQALDARRAALHLVILGDSDVYGGAGQSHYALWGEAARRAAEALPLVEAA